tara:strand:+ start:1336 stop:2064 length:729 start_codon:yes stop_codon:yes gene_type:complete
MSNKIAINYSPNFTTPARKKKNIKYIIFHYTGMSSETKAISRLTDVKSNVSCHYFIKKNGEIILMVPEKYEAWHAGISNWKKDSFLNKTSIGIEISNKGHRFGYEKYSNKQILSLIKLSRLLIKKFKIKTSNIVGHSDIAFDRKVDPGEKFPWKLLSKKKIGIWHQLHEEKLRKLRKKKITEIQKRHCLNFIKKIGYFAKKNNKKNQIKLFKNFQRRFRQELINGILDKECLIIAEKLSKIS